MARLHLFRLLLAALAVVATPGVASGQSELNIIQPSTRGMMVWPIHVGEMLGYFAEEGLSLNLVASDATIPFTMFIASGDADLALLDSLDVLQAANAGLGISAVYSVHRQVPRGVWVSEASAIYSLSDLRGKTVGLGSYRDLTMLQIELAHAETPFEGIDTVVVGDSGAVLTGVFTSGLADAFAGASTSIVPLRVQGIGLREITPPSANTAPANSYVIRSDRMAELQGPVCGFLRAWSKGVYIGQQDIEIIAAMSRHPDGVPEVWEDQAFGYGYLHAIADLVIPKAEPFGAPDVAAWQAVQNDMLMIGDLDIRSDVYSILDDSFLACANDFDRAEVLSEARAWMADPVNAAYVRHVD